MEKNGLPDEKDRKDGAGGLSEEELDTVAGGIGGVLPTGAISRFVPAEGNKMVVWSNDCSE
jgi:hypothetical protein